SHNRSNELALPPLSPPHHGPLPRITISIRRNHSSPIVSTRVLQHNLSKEDMPSLPPPALCECRHRVLARRSIAARRVTTLIVPECQRPQPRHFCALG